MSTTLALDMTNAVTLFSTTTAAYVQAGAGVVADSDPTYEYNETVNKAKGMLRAIALARTIG